MRAGPPRDASAGEGSSAGIWLFLSEIKRVTEFGVRATASTQLPSAALGAPALKAPFGRAAAGTAAPPQLGVVPAARSLLSPACFEPESAGLTQLL